MKTFTAKIFLQSGALTTVTVNAYNYPAAKQLVEQIYNPKSIAYIREAR